MQGYRLTGYKHVPVAIRILSTTAIFEATVLPGHRGCVRTFYIDNINLHTTLEKSFTLDDTRMKKFKKEIELKVHRLLFKNLSGDYLNLLNSAVARTRFPRP